ncbi:MAG: ATP-binding protein [Planctomycetota bacterium]|nr:ATP-binding protein [Planctomycetota bacterium]
MSSEPGKTTSWKRQFDLASSRTDIDVAVGEVLQACTDLGMEEPATFAIRLSLEEAMANAMTHGNGGDETKRILLDCHIDADQVVMAIQDEGPGFDPDTVPDPTADENLTIASGRGLALIKAFMTHVEIPRPGNRLELVFERS